MAVLSLLPLTLTVVLLFLTSAFLRLLYILPSTHPTPPVPRKRPQNDHQPHTRLLVVLGSGGHTAEMLAMLRELDTSLYTHRSYVVSAGDGFSAQKAREFESGLVAKRETGEAGTKMAREQQKVREGEGVEGAPYDISTVPRARQIHQSLLTTPLSALHCLWACIQVLRGRPHRETGIEGKATGMQGVGCGYPDLIISNGPGTGVCVIFAALLLRFFGVPGTEGKMRTIYVESWARVKGLSLSGRILVRCVDRFLVQWEGLRGLGGRAEYIGVLV
ncbi:MAG: hypothetical protein M1819_006552 [Sarea resinae]|nr:MAG: hypothetical protein M1819_006552 [Sarea resinae]